MFYVEQWQCCIYCMSVPKEEPVPCSTIYNQSQFSYYDFNTGGSNSLWLLTS